MQGRIQDLIRGGAPDRDRPKTAILGPQFCRILVLGPHFWWSGGARAPGPPPWIRPCNVHHKGKLFALHVTTVWRNEVQMYNANVLFFIIITFVIVIIFPYQTAKVIPYHRGLHLCFLVLNFSPSHNYCDGNSSFYKLMIKHTRFVASKPMS